MDMPRRFHQIRTQTTRGKGNSEIRSSAVTTIGKTLFSVIFVIAGEKCLFSSSSCYLYASNESEVLGWMTLLQIACDPKLLPAGYCSVYAFQIRGLSR